MKPSDKSIKKVMGYLGGIKTAKKTASSRKNAAKAAAARKKERGDEMIATCCRACAKRKTCKGVVDFPVCDRTGECTATEEECNAECGAWVCLNQGA